MERSNLPRRSQPHLLVESVLELREEVGFYLSFQDEEVFQGLDLPQEEGDSSPAIALLWLSLKFQTLLTSLRHPQHQKQFLSILAGRQSCIPPDQCTLQGKHPHQPLSLDQEEDLEYLPILPQLPIHPVHLKLHPVSGQHLLLPHRH